MRRDALVTAMAGAAVCALLAASVESLGQEAYGRVSTRFEEAFLTIGASSDPPVNIFHNGHWELTGMTLRDLIRVAYATEGVLNDNQVLRGPEWARSTRYRVHATMHPSAAARPDAAALSSLMLQRFLMDRFLLAIRRDTQYPEARGRVNVIGIVRAERPQLDE